MLPFILILLAAMALACLIRRSFAQTLPFCVLATVLITYLCTAIGYKSMALGAVGLLTILLWVVVLLAKRSELRVSFHWPNPAVCAFSLAAVVAFTCTSHLLLLNFDDVAHWALYARQQCGLENFPNALQSASEFADYPPGIQMLAVFLQIGSPFKHSMLFTANLLWLVSLALPLLESLQWKKRWWQNLLLVTTGSALLLAFPAWFTKYYIYSLVVEPAMALLLGYALLHAYKTPEPAFGDVVTVSMALSVLALAKSTGVMYAAFGIMAILLLWGKPFIHALKRPVSLLVAFAGICAPFGFLLTWKILCRLKGTSSYFTQDAPTAYGAENLWRFFAEKEWLGPVGQSFWKTFAISPMNQWSLGLSALAFLAVLWLALLLLRKVLPRWRKMLAAQGLLTLCFFVYAVMLCYSYLYLFEDWEGEQLAAYHRYIMPLPLAMSVLLLGALVPVAGALWQNKKRWLTVAICTGLLVCCGWNVVVRFSPKGYLSQVKTSQTVWLTEYPLYEEQSAKAAEQAAKSGSRVLILSAKPSWDHSSRLYKYFFTPAQTQVINPVEDADWSHTLPQALQQSWNYLWCAPSSEELDLNTLIDSTGRPLVAGALYQVHPQTGQLVLVELAAAQS